jgi:hypothetical protein
MVTVFAGRIGKLNLCREPLGGRIGSQNPDAVISKAVRTIASNDGGDAP